MQPAVCCFYILHFAVYTTRTNRPCLLGEDLFRQAQDGYQLTNAMRENVS
jgi:hypothetical protein